MSSLQPLPAVDSAMLTASIGSAVLYLVLVRSPPSFARMGVKTVSTALLSAVVAVQGGPLLLVGALALGSAGDAFLAWDDETSFLCGLGCFLTAHLLYVVLFLANTNTPAALWVLVSGWRAIVAGALGLLVPVMIVLLVPRISPKLRPPVVLYCMVILAMALTALMLDSNQVILGAVMFCTSDSILAVDRFLVSRTSSFRPWMQHAVWVLYYAGQLLIALGVLSMGVGTLGIVQ